MNPKNEIVGVNKWGKPQSRRKVEHRHGNNWRRRQAAAKAKRAK